MLSMTKSEVIATIASTSTSL